MNLRVLSCLIVCTIGATKCRAGVAYYATGATHVANLDGTGDAVLSELRGGRFATDARHNLIFSASTNVIQSARLDGSNVVEILSMPEFQRAFDIDVDPVNQQLYWSDYVENGTGGTSVVFRSDYNGNNRSRFLEITERGEEVIGIEIDPIGRKLYWFDGGRTFNRAGLDGPPNAEIIYECEEDCKQTPAMTLDADGGKIYFTSWPDVGGPNVLNEMNLDGSGRRPLATTQAGADHRHAIDFDPVGRDIYIDLSLRYNLDSGQFHSTGFPNTRAFLIHSPVPEPGALGLGVVCASVVLAAVRRGRVGAAIHEQLA